MKYIDAEEITPIMAEYVADVFSRKEHLDDISYGYCMEIADVFRRYAERAKQEQPLEEPDKGLEGAANEFANQDCVTFISRKKGFIAGAEWQEKRWENNRLMAQDKATEEECQREMDFVDNHIKKHHRIPTFSDAINYGIEWHQKQMPMPEDTLIFRKGVEEGKRLMMEDAVEGEVIKTDKHTSVRYKSFYGTDRYFYGIADKQFNPGDKVRIIIVKEDGQ